MCVYTMWYYATVCVPTVCTYTVVPTVHTVIYLFMRVVALAILKNPLKTIIYL